MQDLIIRCDICGRQIDQSEKRHCTATLSTGLRQDGPHPMMVAWKDICDNCSFALASLLNNFKTVQRKNREDE